MNSSLHLLQLPHAMSCNDSERIGGGGDEGYVDMPQSQFQPTQQECDEYHPATQPPRVLPWLRLIPQRRATGAEDRAPLDLVEVSPGTDCWGFGRLAAAPPKARVPWTNDYVTDASFVSNWHAKIQVTNPGPTPGSLEAEREEELRRAGPSKPSLSLPASAVQRPWSMVTIYDNSTNGTFINDVRCDRHKWYPLSSGDQIKFCCIGIYGPPRDDFHWLVHLPYQNLGSSNGIDVAGILDEDEAKFYDRYIFQGTLGSGAFATVFRAFDKDNNEHRAIKRIDKRKHPTSQRAQNLEHFRRELDILSKMNHPNIVKFYGSLETNQYIFIVQELIEGGEFLDYIMNANGLEEEHACMITAMLTQAVAYLARCHIAHRDLKPENIMMTSGPSPMPKIVDFGLAKLVTDPDDVFKTQCGTPAYLAPEIVLDNLRNANGGYSTSVDAYSLGVIVYAALANAMPYETDAHGLRKQVTERRVNVLHLRGQFSDYALDFVAGLTKHDPQERLTAAQAVRHPWIAKWTLRSDLHSAGSSLPTNPSSQDSFLVPYIDSQPTAAHHHQRHQRHHEPILDDVDEMGHSQPFGPTPELAADSSLGFPTLEPNTPIAMEMNSHGVDETVVGNRQENTVDGRFSQELQNMNIQGVVATPAMGNHLDIEFDDSSHRPSAPPSREGEPDTKSNGVHDEVKKRMRQWSSSSLSSLSSIDGEGSTTLSTTFQVPNSITSFKSRRHTRFASTSSSVFPSSPEISKAFPKVPPRRTRGVEEGNGGGPRRSMRLATITPSPVKGKSKRPTNQETSTPNGDGGGGSVVGAGGGGRRGRKVNRTSLVVEKVANFKINQEDDEAEEREEEEGEEVRSSGRFRKIVRRM